MNLYTQAVAAERAAKIERDMLEHSEGVADIKRERDELKQQRDELLAICERVVNNGIGFSDVKAMKEIIASVKSSS